MQQYHDASFFFTPNQRPQQLCAVYSNPWSHRRGPLPEPPYPPLRRSICNARRVQHSLPSVHARTNELLIIFNFISMSPTGADAPEGDLEPGWLMQSRLLSSIARVVSTAPVAVQQLFDLGTHTKLLTLLRFFLFVYVLIGLQRIRVPSKGMGSG